MWQDVHFGRFCIHWHKNFASLPEICTEIKVHLVQFSIQNSNKLQYSISQAGHLTGTMLKVCPSPMLKRTLAEITILLCTMTKTVATCDNRCSLVFICLCRF